MKALIFYSAVARETPQRSDPRTLLNRPSFVLQGNDQCSNTHNESSNLIPQHNSAPSLLAEGESPLQTPKPAQIAAQPPLCTVCCPCLSPADHMDTFCSQTAPAVSELHPWKPGSEKQDPRRRWEQSLPDSPWVSP